MKQIILEKLKIWTNKIPPLESRIKIFEQIRDIPYYLVPAIDDPDDWAASILELNQGSCSPKHYLLGLLFNRLGIPVKYASYPFKWDEQPLPYTEELRKLAQGSPITYHLACRIYINDQWILVDATWDMALKKAGFPVNKNWDGLSQTVNGVLPFKEIIHESLQDRLIYVKDKKDLYTQKEKAVYAEFTLKFNAWLESLRLN